MDYLKLLENSYIEAQRFDPNMSERLEYLAEHIFDITTYDSEMDALFATKAVEVCEAISTKKTGEYIEDKGSYVWYLTMCNFPFFSKRIEWGTSIRYAWWDVHGPKTTTIESCGIFDGRDQMLELELDEKEWPKFIAAVIEFSKVERLP